MENIFEGAKFGDKFITKGGRIMLFQRKFSDDEIYLISDFCIWTYNSNGETNDGTNDGEMDIVSRYKEHIDGVKFNELAREEWKNKGYNYKVLPSSINDTKYGFILGFQAGYHKAKEE